MKLTKSLPTLAFMLFTIALQAQISEEMKSMSLGVNSAMILELPGTNEKLVEGVWKDYIKRYDGKTKKNKKFHEYFTDDAEIVSIGGPNTIDIYIRVEESGEDVDLNFWVDMGGAFLTSSEHPSQYKEAEKFLMRFALEVAKEKTRQELDEEEKTLKKMESNLKKLIRANEGFHKDIERAQERIRKAEENIAVNEKDQEGSRKEIEKQQEIINAVRKRLSEL